MNVLRRKIERSALESTLIAANHPSGCSDLAVLERYFAPLCNGELEDDAVVYYGRLLEKTDIRFIPAFVEVVSPLVERDPLLLNKLQFRFGDTFRQLQGRCADIRAGLHHARQGVADGLKKHYEEADFELTDTFVLLLARLDASA